MKKHILPLLLTLALLLPWCCITPEAAHAADKITYGVDVSAYNGKVDWSLLAGNGLDFVILRGGKKPSQTEAYYEDSEFDKNYEAARSVGLKVGVYMRCGATTWPKFEEAVNSYIKTLEGKEFDYPVFLDVEEAAQEKLGKKVMTQFVMDGLAMLREAGFHAGSYANLNWYTNFLDADAIRAEGYDMWIARYTDDPTAEDFSSKYDMWQYSCKGKLPGNGSSAIDLDLSYVDFNYAPDLRPVKDTFYNSILPLRASVCGTQDVVPFYADGVTPIEGVTVPADSECLIQEVYTNGLCRFSFYSKSGRRIGYLPLSAFVDQQIPVPMEVRCTPDRVVTYADEKLTQSSGEIPRRTLCQVLRETADAVQVFYPVSGGCKLGWISMADWETGYLVLLQEHVLGLESLSETELLHVDCNHDGAADAFDLGLMRRNLLSLGHAKPETQYSKLERHLANMTLQEKVYQLFLVTPEALLNSKTAVTSADAAAQAALLDRPVGGILCGAQNLSTEQQVKSLISGMQSYARSQHGTGLWIAVDEEGGTVAPVAQKLGTAAFQSMETYGAKGDAAAAYSVGEDLARDLSALGFNLDLAPVADVRLNAANGLGGRQFGSDPAVVATMSGAVVQGLQSSGKVSATLKHFPGLGAAAEDASQDSGVAIDRTYAQLSKEEFAAFRSGISQGADLVMVGHQTVSCAGDGLPSDLSHTVVTDWLREELGFKGVIVTDSQSLPSITEHYSAGDAAKFAIVAGADMVLLPTDLDEAFAAVYKAVRSGEIPESRIDSSVRRILRAKDKHGLLDQ